MKFIPLPQQVHTVKHMLDHRNSLVFSDPGTGKTAATLEVIATLLADHEIKGVLLIAPLRVTLLTWPAEAAKYDQFRWMRVVNLRHPEGKAAWARGEADIYLLNPEMLPAFCSQPWGIFKRKEIPVDMLVIDELSRFKAPSGKRARALAPYRQFFKRHVGLTGSPAANGLLDLFAPVRIIDGGERLGSSFTQFRERYFTSDWNGWKWTLRESAKENIERKIADITITQRREDWLHLPPTSTEDVEVSMGTELRKQYTKFQKELLLQLQRGEIVALNAASLVQKLLQFTSGAIYDEDRTVHVIHSAKIDALVKLVKQIKAPVLVATAFIHERERILKAVKGAEEFSEGRLEAWNRGEIPCWVADPRAIGHGLNLQAGSCNIIWFSLTYSRELFDQMCCRLIRTGQDKPTTIWRLMIPFTVDDAVAEALRIKGEGQDALMSTLQNLETLSKIPIRP